MILFGIMTLTHGQVHAALAYYYDHRAEIDVQEAKDLAEAEALRQQYPSKLTGKTGESWLRSSVFI